MKNRVVCKLRVRIAHLLVDHACKRKNCRCGNECRLCPGASSFHHEMSVLPSALNPGDDASLETRPVSIAAAAEDRPRESVQSPIRQAHLRLRNSCREISVRHPFHPLMSCSKPRSFCRAWWRSDRAVPPGIPSISPISTCVKPSTSCSTITDLARSGSCASA